jgi:hypothetical protein
MPARNSPKDMGNALDSTHPPFLNHGAFHRKSRDSKGRKNANKRVANLIIR